jgi:transcriptional regulator with XRE-family HTH domain
MPFIEPKALKQLRKIRQLTLEQLAAKADLDKQSIHRLEQGHRNRARASTLDKLAEALDVDKERLTTPLGEGEEAEIVSTAEPNKFQLNLRVSGQARNALLLASARYHVKPAQIVELAPFLFFWVAEKCLLQRVERLVSLQKRNKEFWQDLNELIEGPPPPDEWKDSIDEVLYSEEAAIDLHFLFNEFGGGGPIADFLAGLAAELGDEADFDGWDWGSSPAYSVCKNEATWLANGDETAIENILQGYAPLHELSKEDWEQLRNRDAFAPGDAEKIKSERQQQAAKRVEWLRAHGKPSSDASSEVVS